MCGCVVFIVQHDKFTFHFTQESVRQICAVVATALFDGQIQKLGRVGYLLRLQLYVRNVSH